MTHYIYRKKNIMEITKEFIRENQDKTLKELFLDVCKVDLKIGQWYRRDKELLVWNGGKNTYGFNRLGNYMNDMCCGYIIEPIIPTSGEVSDALAKEAVKRGFKQGVIIKSKWHGRCSISESLGFLKSADTFWVGGCRVMVNGDWAEIVQKMTKEEAEEKFNIVII